MILEVAKAALGIENVNFNFKEAHMNPNQIKTLLSSMIRTITDDQKNFCIDSNKDFSRRRKLTMHRVITGILGMGSGSLTNELTDLFDDPTDMPTASAFCQQRCKISSTAFETLFRRFSTGLIKSCSDRLPVFAIDGSKIQIPTDPDDADSFFQGTNGQKPYNLLHLNALYDLTNRIYIDAIIQKSKFSNEHRALTDMIDRSDIKKAIVIADRGYESYNNLAHIQEKGWFFLIRIKDGDYGIKQGLPLPDEDVQDVCFELNLTRKQTNDVKELFKDRAHYRHISNGIALDYLPQNHRKHDALKFYRLSFRIVRFPISEGSYESVITNLPAKEYPVSKIKRLYASRWGIETSFRDLKYTMGMLDFHSKKVMCILQEIYSHMIMYNFAEMITSHVVIKKKQRKYTYKANFSVAAHMCKKFYRGITSPPDLETIISRNLVPIRTDRHRERKPSAKIFKGFLYRVA